MEILKEREIIDKLGNCILADEILSKANLIILYFGSAWSDATCNILPQLIEIYAASKVRNMNIEIIFISSDKDATSMKNYFSTHGDWYAVLYDDILADELRWAYMVQQLPFLVATKPNGKLVSKNAFQDVMDYGKSVLIKWF